MGKIRVSPRKFNMFKISPGRGRLWISKQKSLTLQRLEWNLKTKPKKTETREMLNFVRDIRQTQTGKPKKFNIPWVSVMLNGE